MEEPRSRFRGLARLRSGQRSQSQSFDSPPQQQRSSGPVPPARATHERGRAAPHEIEEDHLQLALAISAAEAEKNSGRRTQPTAQQPTQADTSRDEELARELQRQLNSNSDGHNGRPGASVSSAHPQPQPSAPLTPSPGRLAALPSPAQIRRAGSDCVPTWPPSPAIPEVLAARVQAGVSPTAATVPSPFGSALCATCGKPVRLWHSHAKAGGQSFHSWCLKCARCRQQIQVGPGSLFLLGQDQRPYHPPCHKAQFHPTCSVCRTFLPQGEDGVVRFHLTPFWGNRFCPAHERDDTPRCTACNRLQIHGEEWVQTEAGRHSCLECLASLVRNTADAQPLYDDVLSLYAVLGMPLPTRPPLMLVESAALNEASHTDCGPRGKQDGPVFHTRGLTLSEEHRSIRTVIGTRRDAGRLMSIVPAFNAVESSHWEVTALLVLFGLPWLLTGSILAHEVMHAWLRLSGFKRLPTEVEEGLAQLMALLWLERQRPQPGSYEERLASYLGKQIREDPTHVYGEGFRAALDAFQRHGLPHVLEHVRRHGALPP